MFVLCVSADMNNSRAEYTVFHFPQSRLILRDQDKIIKWCWDVGMVARHTHTNALSDMIHEQIPRITDPKNTILIRTSVLGGSDSDEVVLCFWDSEVVQFSFMKLCL